jgi:hypothetical protein
MKKPRVEDFDPKGAAPLLKSPMDQLPTISPGGLAAGSAGEEGEGRARSASANSEMDRTPVPPPVRPYARTLTRIPFEIYRDQHASLKKFSLEEQTRGEKGSMSQMVREALDMYIARRLNREEG